MRRGGEMTQDEHLIWDVSTVRSLVICLRTCETLHLLHLPSIQYVFFTFSSLLALTLDSLAQGHRHLEVEGKCHWQF